MPFSSWVGEVGAPGGSDAGEGMAPSLHAGNVKTHPRGLHTDSDSAPTSRGSRGGGQTHREVKQGSRGRRDVTRSAAVSGGGGRERTHRGPASAWDRAERQPAARCLPGGGALSPLPRPVSAAPLSRPVPGLRPGLASRRVGTRDSMSPGVWTAVKGNAGRRPRP